MNKKPDRTMIYIGISVVLLLGAIVATSVINSQPSSEADIRAKASLQAGIVYEGIVNSIDTSGQTLIVESLKPKDGGMALTGIWTVQVPSTLSLSGISIGSDVQLTVDSKTFDIQNHSMQVKNIVAK